MPSQKACRYRNGSTFGDVAQGKAHEVYMAHEFMVDADRKVIITDALLQKSPVVDLSFLTTIDP